MLVEFRDTESRRLADVGIYIVHQAPHRLNRGLDELADMNVGDGAESQSAHEGIRVFHILQVMRQSSIRQ